MQRLTLVVTLTALLLDVVGRAQAGTLIDQSNTAAVQGYYAPSASNIIGQSFTATATSMNYAQFFTNYNSDFQIGVKVELLNGAGLNGSVLGTSDNVTFTRPSTAPDANPPITNPRPVDFNFASPISLIAGQQYTLAVLVAQPTPQHQNFFTLGETGNVYAGSTAYETVTGGAINDDLYFKEGFSSILGDSQNNPVLPEVNAGGQYVFTSVASGSWFDPASAYGFDYKTTDGSLFTKIDNFPTTSGPVVVSSDGQVIGTYSNGNSVDFTSLLGHGVSEFEVTGINPLVDPTNTSAFALQLEFNNPTASFTMDPLTVPEPSAFVI